MSSLLWNDSTKLESLFLFCKHIYVFLQNVENMLLNIIVIGIKNNLWVYQKQYGLIHP